MQQPVPMPLPLSNEPRHWPAVVLRLQEAALMLLTTDASVEDIADSLHFSSPNYFVTSFYHRYRMTPEAYRSSNDL